jgi:hypothetical protein
LLRMLGKLRFFSWPLRVSSDSSVAAATWGDTLACVLQIVSRLVLTNKMRGGGNGRNVSFWLRPNLKQRNSIDILKPHF